MSIYLTGFWINNNTTSYREVLLGGTTLATIIASPLRAGSNALRCTAATTNTSFAKILGLGSQGQVGGAPSISVPNSYQRFYFSWATKAAANSEQIFVIADIAGNEKMRINLNSSAQLEARDSTGGAGSTGTLMATTATALTQNGVYRIESLTGTGTSANWAVNLYAGDSTTPLESIAGTGNLGTGNTFQIILGKESNLFNQSVDYYFGDFFWADTGFPGPGQCALLLPIADGTFAVGTPNGAAQRWQCVDEIPPDGDTSYINGLTLGQSYTAQMQGGITASKVNSVKIYMAGKRETGNTSFIASLLSGGVLSGTDGNVLGFANYVPLQKTFDADPATGAPWTSAAINAMQAGFTLNNANPGRVTAVYAMVDYVPAPVQLGWIPPPREVRWNPPPREIYWKGTGFTPSTPGPPPPTGHTYYVSTTGSDTNTGTAAKPFQTIAHGASVLVPGDTLIIRGGTYTTTLNDVFPSGTAAKPITISAYAGETVILQPNSSTDNGITFSSSSYITLQNLIIDGSNLSAVGIAAVKMTYQSSSVYSHHITLSGCEVRNVPYAQANQGILMTCLSDGAEAGFNQILNCLVHDNGGTTGAVLNQNHGLYIQTSNNVIAGNHVYNNLSHGIQLEHDDATDGSTVLCSNNKVYNNFSYNNLNRAGVLVANGTNNQIFNNVCYGNDDAGILCQFGCINTLIYNNTCYGNHGNNGEAGLHAGSTGHVTATWTNNICYGNGGGDYHVSAPAVVTSDYNLSGDGTATGAHSLTNANPIFLNQGAADFRLGSLSSALNAGTSTAPTVTKDILGLARPQGSAYSMGAYDASYTRTPLTFYTNASGGSDSNSGSLASPFLTIAKGLTQLAPDDTLLVRAGTYAEALLTVPGGLSGHQVTVSGYLSETAIVQPTVGQLAAAVANFSGGAKKFITIKNLTLDGTNLPASNSVVFVGTTGTASTDITISGCVIHNAPSGDGVHTSGDSDRVTVTGCTISSNGTSSNAGIKCLSASNTFSGNDITSAGHAIEIDASATHSQDSNTIKGNKLHGAGKSGLYIQAGAGNLVFNNLSYSNTTSGITVDTSANAPTGTLLYNNTLYGNNAGHSSAGCISLIAGTSGAIVKNNISYNASGLKDYNDAATGTVSDYNLTKDGTGVGTHTLINTDPLFVTNGSDFHIQSTSPAKNAGVTLASVPTDFDGVARPHSTAYCIGAYEDGV